MFMLQTQETLLKSVAKLTALGLQVFVFHYVLMDLCTSEAFLLFRFSLEAFRYLFCSTFMFFNTNRLQQQVTHLIELKGLMFKCSMSVVFLVTAGVEVLLCTVLAAVKYFLPASLLLSRHARSAGFIFII